MKKHIISAMTVMVLVLSQVFPGIAGSSVIVDRVIAVVNDEIITMSDLQREQTKNNDNKADERLLLEEMIDRKLQMSAAKRAGMDVTEKELSEAIADIMKRYSMDRKQFEAELAKEGLTLEQYRAELKEQMTLSRVFNKYVRSGMSVDDREIRVYYEQNAKVFTLPEEIRVRHIFLKLPQNASAAQKAEAREKAAAVAERAKKGEDFILLVREFSESRSAVNDGDLGYMQREHALPEIEQATRSLKPGEIAGPIQTASGFYVIRLEEARMPVKPLEKVKDEISNILYQQKVENSYKSWLQTLRSESHIENRL